MENLFNSIAPALLFISSVLGLGTQPTLITPSVGPDVVQSVELGLSETSPRGEQGGYAMPASGCSALDPNWGNGTHPNPPAACSTTNPTITATPGLVRYGSEVVISWNPNGHSSCFLTQNLTSLTGGLNPTTPLNANAPGSRKDVATGQETYAIICYSGVTSYQAEVTVKVLPRIQET